MKNILLLLTILLTASFVSAYVDCRENINGCSIEQLIGLCQSSPNGNQDKINACKNAVTKINERISYLTNVAVNVDSSCQKITNKMWLRTSRINDSQVNGDVSRMQKFFKRIGIITWDGDGEFGTWDKAAVWKFQQQYMPEISPTGDVGVKTMTKINSMICNTPSANLQGRDVNFSWELIPTNKKGLVSLYPIISVVLKLKNVSAVGLIPVTSVTFEVDNSCQIQYTVNAENGGIAPWLFCNGKHEFEKYAVFWEGGNYVLKHAVESGKDGSMPYQFFKQITFYN
jgi:hypothetical protein